MAAAGKNTSRDGSQPSLATRAVQGPGGPPTAGQGPATPIERSTTWALDDGAYALRRGGRASESRVYARETNPTVESLERRLADLEGAQRAVTFASGMAALHAILLATLERGDNVALVRRVYGGTSSLLGRLLPKLGVELRPVALSDPDSWRAVLDERTRLFLCESLSNPLTEVADLPEIARALNAGASPRALLVVDATLASPILQRPQEHGADLVWHSATKYLAGHSDALAGAVLGPRELLEEVWSWRCSAGGCLDPAAASLVERGLKTLPLRMAAHCENATAVARFLEGHGAVGRVHFAGLASHPHHELCRRLLSGPGGLLSFEVVQGDEAARRMIRRLELFTEAASLGSVESLATCPTDLSHDGLSEGERRAAGLLPGLVRLAVGVEGVDDLIADLDQALAG